METVKRIAKNTGVIFSAQIISGLLGLFFVIYTARYLGVRGFGVLSFALAFTAIFDVFTNFGLSELTIREVARDKSLAGKYQQNIIVIRFILIIINFGLIVLVLKILNYPWETTVVVYLIALSLCIGSFTRVFYTVFLAFEKMEYQAIGLVLNSILLLCGALYAISQNFSIIGFALVYFFISIVILVYAYIVSFLKFAKPKLQLDLIFWKSTIKNAWAFFLLGFVNVIAFRIDMVMLSVMKGDLVVGWYGASYRLIDVMMFIPIAFVGSIYPVLSNFYLSSKEHLFLIYEKSFKYLFTVSLPIAVGITLLADKIILFIYQSEFIPSIIALQILIWTIPLIFLTYMYGTLLASVNKQKLSFMISFSCMSLNIAINLIFIPKYSYIAASIATVITYLLSLILCFYFISKHVHKIQIHQFIVKPIIACAIMAAFIFYFTAVNLFLLISLSILIYFVVFFLIKGFSKEDFKLFRQIINIIRKEKKGE
jgi:O-antigen/teichoic acid export membrane protein